MSDQKDKQFVQESIDSGLSMMQGDPWLAQRIINQERMGGIIVNKRVSVGLVLAIVLMLITVTALAATGAFQKLWEVWQSSFQKMNTTGAVEIVEDFDHEAFEAEYGGVKEDLIISTIPRDEDLDYDRAYAIARQAIVDRFGTPENELDAMGVYPSFYESPYQDKPSEWIFYFSSRRDVNIDEDHHYDAPGEYQVWIESPSGEVTNCIWYLDAFFPDYARRTWEAGKTDYVFAKAKSTQFYAQSQEDQTYFIELFEKAGYDISTISKSDEQQLASIEPHPECYPLPRQDEATARNIADQYLNEHYPDFSSMTFDQVACRLIDQDSYFETPYYVFDYFIGDNPAYEIIIHAGSGEIQYSAGPEDGNG